MFLLNVGAVILMQLRNFTVTFAIHKHMECTYTMYTTKNEKKREKKEHFTTKSVFFLESPPSHGVFSTEYKPVTLNLCTSSQ